VSQYLAAHGYDVYRYHYEAVFANQALFTTNPNQGAYHTAEIPEAFGTWSPGSTPSEIQLSQVMQTFWANTAKYGQPGAPWPKLGSVLARLSASDWAGGGAIIEPLAASVPDKNCGLYNAIGELAELRW
jgi:hypothetical protein